MIRINFVRLIVECKQITTIVERYETQWSLGSCSLTSDDYIPGTVQKLTKMCCLPPEQHVLRCESSNNMAWKQSSIEIAGHKFCDDFVGYATLRKIDISGKKH